jgi:hypothetical protein
MSYIFWRIKSKQIRLAYRTICIISYALKQGIYNKQKYCCKNCLQKKDQQAQFYICLRFGLSLAHGKREIEAG